ncbi:hypothetical protein ACFY7H_22025 [Streptomyces sp. NPDC012794]|uniref:hypothetical protein n=1 Tax=Streptomyces sp. NPDC012794 TaxID=3364850 RepID=UPI0036AFBAA4
MPRRPRVMAVAVALLVCGAVSTACGPGAGAGPGARRAEPLTAAELLSVLPSGKDLPGFVVTARGPAAAATPSAVASRVAPGHPAECQALVDFELDHGAAHRPAARVVATVAPRSGTSDARRNVDFGKLHSVALSSHTVEEASAVLESLRKAVPLCGGFLVYTLAYGDQDARVVVGGRPAPAAGDDAVAFDWTVPGIAMEQTVPVTVVRTGGVLTAYSGAVPAGVAQGQHRRLRAFLSGSAG